LAPGSQEGLAPGSQEGLAPGSEEGLVPGFKERFAPDSGNEFAPDAEKELAPGSKEELTQGSGEGLSPGSSEEELVGQVLATTASEKISLEAVEEKVPTETEIPIISEVVDPSKAVNLRETLDESVSSYPIIVISVEL